MINWKRMLLYMLGLGTAAGTPLALMEAGFIGNATPEKRIEIPMVTMPINSSDTANGDENLRTSDMEGERGTQANTVYSSQPPKGTRICSICMDNYEDESKGGGACGGHGGVRYWLYRTAEGAILQHATQRHKDHPADLSAEEKSNLSASNRGEKKKDSSWALTHWAEMLTVFVVCITIAYVTKIWWKNDNVSS